MSIAAVHTELITARLLRSWGPEAPRNHLIAVTVVADDGAAGTGFSWTPTIGARAVQALLDDDLAGFVRGRSEHPEVLWDDAWKFLHEGGAGLTGIALAGIDLALWDLRARRAGLSVTDLLGRRQQDVAVYGSGVNLHYELDELQEQVGRWIAAGFGAVKIKVGRPDLREDVERVAAVRELLGPDRGLMIDANQRWDLPTARRALDALEPFAPSWLEEPLRADDLEGYRQLRRFSRVPIALGENLHNVYRFRDFIAAGAVDIVQPNIVRVGGITPFRRIVELARTHNVGIAPHLLPELSGQLALTLAEPTMVEVVEDAGFADLGILAGPSPVRVTGSRLEILDRPGLGLVLQQQSSPAVADALG
ncbi:mandelate racemase/muconate lactonizing enzyme family protein [Kocuria arenosa]|uniref:mandelate racemase/muconate lactonizing enzyme family protein n=1 Tax=Kocuria arenosa TaxID=3071446 RepID=UPI0034D6B6A6